MPLDIVTALSVLSTVQSIYGLFSSMYSVVRNTANLLGRVEEANSFVSFCQEVERTLHNRDATLRRAVENGEYFNRDTYFRLTKLLRNLQDARNLLDKMANRLRLQNMMPGSQTITRLRGIRQEVLENITMLTFHYTVGPQPTRRPNREQTVHRIPQRQPERQITRPTPQHNRLPVYPSRTALYASNYQFVSPSQSYRTSRRREPGLLDSLVNMLFD